MAAQLYPAHVQNMRHRGRTMSPNVLRLQEGLVTYLNDTEQSELLSALEEYNSKRNVFTFVKFLHVMLDTPAKKQIIPMLRRVIPRADVTMFDHFNKEVLSVKPLRNNNGKLYRTNSTVSVPADYHYGTISRLNSKHESPRRPQSFWASVKDTESKRIFIERSGYDESWGFSIRGGAEHGIGIYVSYVDVDSAAETQGLVPGDQIINANNVSFERIAHTDAAEVTFV